VAFSTTLQFARQTGRSAARVAKSRSYRRFQPFGEAGTGSWIAPSGRPSFSRSRQWAGKAQGGAGQPVAVADACLEQAQVLLYHRPSARSGCGSASRPGDCLATRARRHRRRRGGSVGMVLQEERGDEGQEFARGLLRLGQEG
jgi:hypothetical protein